MANPEEWGSKVVAMAMYYNKPVLVFYLYNMLGRIFVINSYVQREEPWVSEQLGFCEDKVIETPFTSRV